MAIEWSKISKKAKVSLFALIISGLAFIVFGFLAENMHESSGIEDAIVFLALPGVILALAGNIISLIFAIKALKEIEQSASKLKGKNLAYALIAIDVIWLMVLFN